MAQATVITEPTGITLELTLDEAQQLRALLGQTKLGTVGHAFDALYVALDEAGVLPRNYKVTVKDGAYAPIIGLEENV